jgi:demethylmenaquinone methyltransferase/2-methoxy-6-polyprenyl-1,4-benzoquinol methylase
MQGRMARPQDEMRAYYDQRAPEFDLWWETTGPYEGRQRPGWDGGLGQLQHQVASLPPGRVLDVGCGTGFVTRLLRGPLVVGVDPSPAMLARARARLPTVPYARAEGLALPFQTGAFDRVFTSHVYGHVLPGEREGFVVEAFRVARELVVVDAGPRGGTPREEWQVRPLHDGSRHRVYKRFFDAAALAAELGGGRVLHEGRWFVAVVGVRQSPVEIGCA